MIGRWLCSKGLHAWESTLQFEGFRQGIYMHRACTRRGCTVQKGSVTWWP
jgi:hypothetical protein